MCCPTTRPLWITRRRIVFTPSLIDQKIKYINCMRSVLLLWRVLQLLFESRRQRFSLSICATRDKIKGFAYPCRCVLHLWLISVFFLAFQARGPWYCRQQTQYSKRVCPACLTEQRSDVRGDESMNEAKTRKKNSPFSSSFRPIWPLQKRHGLTEIWRSLE